MKDSRARGIRARESEFSSGGYENGREGRARNHLEISGPEASRMSPLFTRTNDGGRVVSGDQINSEPDSTTNGRRYTRDRSP